MMKLLGIGCGLALLALSSCSPATPATPAVGRDEITQISVINALMLGQYDGVIPVPALLRYGDFGVGTLDHLDGELIVLDGKAYQVRGDGVVTIVSADRTTPFAVVTHFETDGEFTCPVVGNLPELDSRLEGALRQRNTFYAVRVDGEFASITLRSVHRQQPPYEPLSEVAKSQSVWTRADTRGTLVGILSPTWVTGISVPGFHWHFLSDDRQIGGHVLDCKTREGRVRYHVCRDWQVKLPDSETFNSADLAKDLSKSLKKVESSRGEQDSGR
jgi:acetolactate decarboxylase